jgi:hypothetical protein
MPGAVGTFAAFVLDWDIAIRGILVTAVAIATLCGSVYLVLLTNLGSRLGFLIALAGFFAWMTLMGLVWWIYAIGLKGDDPHWEVQELVVHEEPDDLSAAATDRAHDLGGWDEVPEGDPTRGEAQASAEAALIGDDIGLFESTQDFKVIDALQVGGKGDSVVDNWLPLPHPTHFAIVQVQKVVPTKAISGDEECPPATTCYEFGTTPPSPEVDETAPVVSAVMARNLGSKRLPPAVITVSSLAVFGVLVNHLHRRDKIAEAHRRATAGAAT